jgi:tetratricopeptide (TPR) repeat protein
MLEMQFEKNVVEQFLWESYNIDSRRHLYKIINEADDDTRKEIGKHRILQDLFLLRRGRDPGFAFHVYGLINKDDKAFQSTAFYIQKLLLDGSYFDENQIFSPCTSNPKLNKDRSIVDGSLKHTFHLPIYFEERGDGRVNFRMKDPVDNEKYSRKESTKESLEYFNQRYESALENKDEHTADAIRDLIQEYSTSYYSFDYFTKKQKFYWDSATQKKENYEYRKYLSENIANQDLYHKDHAFSERELTGTILGLGLEEDFLKILNNYGMEIITEDSKARYSPIYIKFLMDAFSITSTIWFNSLSLKEKESLLNGVYPLNPDKFTEYISVLNEKEKSSFLMDYLSFNMYQNGSMDIVETIWVHKYENARDNSDKARCLNKLGDIYREKIEYEKAYANYKQSLEYTSKLPLVDRKKSRKNDDPRLSPQYLHILSLLRIAEMEYILGYDDAEKHIQEAINRINRKDIHSKISLMWNLACTYRRAGLFEKEYDCLDILASLGEKKREDLVDKADSRLDLMNQCVLESGMLDQNKLYEIEQEEKSQKLVSISNVLRNSFQFEREAMYLDTALKIHENSGIKYDIAVSKYNNGNLAEAKGLFEELSSCSETDVAVKSQIYLSLTDFQISTELKDLERIADAFLPFILSLSALKEDADIKKEFKQEDIDIVTGFIKRTAMEGLQPVIELCTTNVMLLKKYEILTHLFEFILALSADNCPQDVHLDITYNVIVSMFNRGLTDEAVNLSTKSIEHFNADEMKIGALDTTANLYFLLGQHNKSIDYLNEAFEIDSKHANLWKNQSLNYEKLLDFKKAGECIDKALEIDPNYPGLEGLKEKYNRLKKDTINFTKLKDDDVTKFFMSAERLTLDLSKSINEDEFDFTMALVSYGKGLESMLHNKISRPLRKKIHKKHGILDDDQYGSLPYSLKKILGQKEKTISLGSWQYITDDCRKYSKNTIVRECRDYFAGKLNKDRNIIFDSSKVVSDYRNGSAHHTSKTIDEIMDDRKVIVDKINNVIDVFY